MQKSYQANALQQTQQDRQTKRKKNGSRQQQFGKMAGSVLNSTAFLRLNFSAKLNIFASISATSQSRQTLSVILGCASS